MYIYLSSAIPGGFHYSAASSSSHYYQIQLFLSHTSPTHKNTPRKSPLTTKHFNNQIHYYSISSLVKETYLQTFIIPVTVWVTKWLAMSSSIMKIANIKRIKELVHNLSKLSSLLRFYAYY